MVAGESYFQGLSLPGSPKRIIVALRFLILATVVVLANLGPIVPAWTFWFVAGIYLASNVIYALQSREHFLSGRISGWIFFFDVALVTVLFTLAAQESSDFWIAYFLTILVAALAADIRVSFSAAIVSTAVYAFVLHSSLPDGTGLLSTGFVLHSILFFVTALFVGALAAAAKRERTRAISIEHTLFLSQRMASLLDLKHVIELSRDPRGLAREILDRSQELFEHDAGSLMLADDRSGELAVAVSRGFDPVEGKADPGGISSYVFRTRERLLLIGTPNTDPRFRHLEPRPEIRSSISVPIMHEDHVFGVLNFNRVNPFLPHFTVTDLDKSAAFAVQVGTALSNAKTYRRLDERHRTTSEKLEQLQATHERSIRAEKLSTLEEVASSVARSLNDPLTGILGSAELARERLSPDSALRLAVDAIISDARRCSELVGQLQSVHGHQLCNRVPTDVVRLVDEVLRLREGALKRAGIALITDYAEGQQIAAVDRQMLARVFAHLVENGISAMETRTDALRKLSVGIRREGPDILVSFTDSGSGVRLEHIHSIFQPFFTSRADERAIGLGLATAQRLVQELGGSIRGISDGIEGSTFVVSLPAFAPAEPRWGVDGKREAPFSWPPATARAGSGNGDGDGESGRLLLVDKDPSVIRIVSQALAKGFSVEHAESAEHAIDLLRASCAEDAERYDAVILDLCMPGSGLGVLRAIRNDFPDYTSRLVLSAGSIPNTETTRAIDSTQSPFLFKPFNMLELRDAVNAVAN